MIYNLIRRHNNLILWLLYLGGCCTEGCSSSLTGGRRHPQFLALWVSAQTTHSINTGFIRESKQEKAEEGVSKTEAAIFYSCLSEVTYLRFSFFKSGSLSMAHTPRSEDHTSALISRRKNHLKLLPQASMIIINKICRIKWTNQLLSKNL